MVTSSALAAAAAAAAVWSPCDSRNATPRSYKYHESVNAGGCQREKDAKKTNTGGSLLDFLCCFHKTHNDQQNSERSTYTPWITNYMARKCCQTRIPAFPCRSRFPSRLLRLPQPRLSVWDDVAAPTCSDKVSLYGAARLTSVDTSLHSPAQYSFKGCATRLLQMPSTLTPRAVVPLFCLVALLLQVDCCFCCCSNDDSARQARAGEERRNYWI